MASYIFGGDTGETPETIKQRREIIKALMRGQAPSNVGEGIAALGQGLVAGIEKYRTNKAEKTGLESAGADFSGAMASLFGGGADAAGMVQGGAPASAGTPDGIGQGIAQTAQALGIDPVDLATAISYETGGTFDPKQAGPTTQWGQHRGLIQFGEPQAKQYGVNWDDPAGSQLGPDGAIAKYLRDTGVKPGMGLLDIYSAINAGGVGKYDASDANNGGAPGNVRDKVEQQMGEHRQKALAMLGGGGASNLGGGTGADQLVDPDQPGSIRIGGVLPEQAPSVAALQPEAVQGQEIGAGYDASSPIIRAMMGLSGKQPGNMGAFPAAPPEPTAEQAQLATNYAQGAGQVAQAFPPPPAAPTGGSNATIQALMKAASNPFQSEGNLAIIKAMLGKEMEKMDPAYNMGLEKSRLELDALKNPKTEWQKLDDDTLFSRSGETKELGVSGGPTKFEGTGLDAQAWNILQSADPSSREYATAYSIVSQPKTQLVQTENGMMPVEVPPNLPAWLKAPPGSVAAPAAPADPVTSPAAPSNSSVIPGTKRPKTEAETRYTTISTILLDEVPTIGANFKAMSDPTGQLLAKIPGGIGNMWQSEEYQRAANSVKTSISSVLYALSGATANPGEVIGQIDVLTPKFGEKPGAIADKLERFKTYVRAVASGTDDPGLIKAVEDAIGQMDGGAKSGSKTIGGKTYIKDANGDWYEQ